MRFLSIHLTLTKAYQNVHGQRRHPSEVDLVKPARARINKTHYDQTNNEVSISKCQGGTKSQPLPHCLAVPEQSPVELNLHVSSSSFHFRDIEAATGARTIILQHLRAMMLDARGVVLLRMFCSRYPIHSPPFCKAEDLNVSGTGRRRAPPRCTWQCNMVTSPFLTPVERLLNSSWCTVPAPAVCTTCQVSHRASDARSCHSDIHSSFPPKLELGETPPLSDSG